MVDKFTKPPYGEKLVEKINDIIDNKQDTLVSGTNIKTINNTSLLGSGNIDIQGGGTVTVDDELSTTSTNPVQNKVITNALNLKANSADLSAVATSGSYNDLSNKPTIPAAQVNSDWNASSGVAQILNKPNLAAVATSGSYNDLSNKPTIPSEVTESTVSGWGFTKNTGTVTSVNNVSPINGNVSLTIPDTSNLANKDLSNLSNTGNSKFQAPLVSGTNIKTINNNSILGSGNLTLDGLPSQTGQSGKYLTTNGTVPSWADVNSLPSQTGKAGLYLQTDGTDASWEGVPGRNIGEIVASTIPLTDAGLHLLDGALIQGSGIYSAFVDYIASIYDATANYFCTESEWQTAVTTCGVCGKFVYDSVNNTVRLPKYSNKIYTQDISSSAPVVGNGMTLGLTNGVDNFGPQTTTYNLARLYGFTGYYGTNIGASGVSGYSPSAEASVGVVSDPTKSGLIAQLSDITTSLEGYYYIVVATSTKTDIQVDIDEVVTDLNGKADVDLSNTTPSISFATAMNTAGIRTVVESYVNGASWYRVYSDGWCEQGGQFTASSNDYTLTFLEPFRDVNYNILVSSLANSTSAYYTAKILTKSSTNAHIFANIGQGGYTATMWRACGYIN